jgi:hypothetical protein
MRRTALRGHALRGEGKAYVPAGEGLWERAGLPADLGRALCECGAVSDWHVSDAARKRWHAQHKAAVRAAASAREEQARTAESLRERGER